MTGIDERPARRRLTSNPRLQGNRITYSLILGWLFWLLTGRPSQWAILVIAVIAWAAITFALVMIDRRRWERDNT